MTESWRSRIDAGRTLVLDGATGTELRHRGVRLDPIAWSAPATLSHPDLLAAIHADFLRAGADVVTTNTFGSSRFVLRAAGLDDRFAELNRAAVDAARKSRDIVGREAAIAGSVSCLPPGFDTDAYPEPRAERDAYVELATLLAEAGVDLLVLEMMEETEHARRACEAVRSVGLPFWLGVSARRTPQGALTAYDFPHIPFDDVLDALLEYSPAAVNVMHTPPDTVDAALDALGAVWRGIRGVYPEIGESPDRPGALTSAQLAGATEAWIRRGARIVGGCCGASPDHIRAIAEAAGEADAAAHPAPGS